MGRLDERMKGMGIKLDDLSTKVDAMRAPKMWPVVLGVVCVAGFIGGIGAGWVNLRLEPLKIQQARGEKDFDRLYDEVKSIQKLVDAKSDSKYVDDKIAYAYDRILQEIKIKIAQKPQP